MEHVRVDEADGVAIVTLVDVKRRNAMTAAMVSEIVETFDALEADESIGAVVITGEPPAFCSGADVSQPRRARRRGADDGERGTVVSIYEGFLRVLRSPLPTVAAVNGPAVGAGMNLALACDVRLAGASARFDARFLQIGLHPGGGHTWMLDRAVGPQAAAAIVLFGEPIDGAARGRDRPRVALRARRRAAAPRACTRRPARRASRRRCRPRAKADAAAGAVAARLRRRARHRGRTPDLVARPRLVQAAPMTGRRLPARRGAYG